MDVGKTTIRNNEIRNNAPVPIGEHYKRCTSLKQNRRSNENNLKQLEAYSMDVFTRMTDGCPQLYNYGTTMVQLMCLQHLYTWGPRHQSPYNNNNDNLYFPPNKFTCIKMAIKQNRGTDMIKLYAVPKIVV